MSIETVKINTKSLHYRLADTYGFLGTSPITSCQYITEVLIGVFICVAIVVFCSIVLITIAQLLIWLYVWYAIDFVSPNDWTEFSLMATSVLALIAIVKVSNALGGWLETKTKKQPTGVDATPKPKTPSFFKIWYKSVKQKICVKVEFI